jgi:hypothetical protein
MARKTSIPYKEIIKKNQEEGVPIPELAKIYNIKSTYIYGYLHRRKISSVKMIEDRRKNKPNDTFLNVIDTEEKAYFLGLMMSDGYINVSKSRQYSYKKFGIFIKDTDDKVILNICSLLGITPSYRKDTKMVGFNVSSDQIIKRLEDFGISQNKTYKELHIPNIDKSLIRHFIRGYFDGDGSVSLKKSRERQITVYICGICMGFIKELQQELLKNNIDSSIYIEDRSSLSRKNMIKLLIGKHSSRLTFFDYLYKDSTIFIDRKYSKFKNYYDNTVLNMEIKKSISV